MIWKVKAVEAVSKIDEKGEEYFEFEAPIQNKGGYRTQILSFDPPIEFEIGDEKHETPAVVIYTYPDRSE